MRLLHTSDWHLGRSLHGQKRYDEQQAFLDWLAAIIQSEDVEVLVVAGDVFDNTAPSNRAQELYYRFLWQAAARGCRYTVIAGGNHDSPSLLNAPRELLKVMNIHVIGSALDDPAGEVLCLEDRFGNAGMIICAVPYLRDRDLRTAEAGETSEDKERKLQAGIKGHYQQVGERAAALRSALVAGREAEPRAVLRADMGAGQGCLFEAQIPIVATGHLFAAGGQANDSEGVRELYVGSLARVDRSAFPDCIDYLALGHLHSPQLLNGCESMRYSGAPVAMNFGERGRKSVCVVDFSGCQARVRELEVPVFQALVRIAGRLDELEAAIERLKHENSRAWLEVIYTGEEYIGNLRDLLDKATAGSEMRVLAIKNHQLLNQVRLHSDHSEQLENLDPVEVFRRCLDQRQVPDEQRPELLAAYQEILTLMHEEDRQAE